MNETKKKTIFETTINIPISRVQLDSESNWLVDDFAKRCEWPGLKNHEAAPIYTAIVPLLKEDLDWYCDSTALIRLTVNEVRQHDSI